MQSQGLWGKKYLDIQPRTVEVPPPDADHVVVKVHACGVCGTDVNFVRDWDGDAMPLGHEIAAEVVEAGAAAPYKPGERVIVEDCTMCGVCVDCKSGHPELCRNMYTIEGQPGMGQYMSVRHNSLDRCEGLDYVAACLTEPLAVCLTAVYNADIPLGGSVLVLGAGPLGLMSARLARLRGAATVAIAEHGGGSPRGAARLAAAARMGCDLIIQSARQDVADEIRRVCPQGVDRVIVTAPPQSLPDALKAVRFGGIITFLGLNFAGGTVGVDVNDLIFRKITLRPTFAEPAINFPVATRLLREGLVDAGTLITHTFALDEAVSALCGIVDGSQPIIKAVILPHGLPV